MKTNTPTITFFANLKCAIKELDEALHEACAASTLESDDVKFHKAETAVDALAETGFKFYDNALTELKDEINHAKMSFDELWSSLQALDSACEEYNDADEYSDEEMEADTRRYEREPERDDALVFRS